MVQCICILFAESRKMAFGLGLGMLLFISLMAVEVLKLSTAIRWPFHSKVGEIHQRMTWGQTDFIFFTLI